jgi:hypothetical protein
MFSASRIIAIDDEKDYLDKLTGVLHGMGIPCIPICFPDQVPGDDATWFSGFRIIFCDLHLLKGAAKPELNYGVIGSLLERVAAPGAAPVLLILWTAYPEDADNLRDYLSKRHAAAQPIAIYALRKADFDGPLAVNLPAAVRSKLDDVPQLRALYEWQDDVAIAANTSVGSLLDLARREGGDLKEALDKLLSSLATAATGKELAAKNPGAALLEALTPLLADGIAHLPRDGQRDDLWKKAMPSAVAKAKLESKSDRVCAVNTAMSIVHGDAGAVISARERGAVIEVECPSLFMYRFGDSPGEIMKAFGLKNATPTTHRWVGVQVEAACDFAQQKSPCIPYVLALEVAAAEETKQERRQGRPDSLWESPVFRSEKNEAVRLVANVRYVSMVSVKKAQVRQAVYRLRDPLVNELAYFKSRHELRPGIVALY